MLKNDYFKAILASLIFSFAVLIVLPRIPTFVNNQLFKIDSHIGGYETNIFGLKLDLRGFKGGLDVQGGKKVVLKIEEFNQNNKNEVLSSLTDVTKKRLSLGGYSDYEIGVEDINEGKIYVSVSKFVDFDAIASLVSGNGHIEIKKLTNPDQWDISKASEIIMKPEEWTSTGLTNNEIKDLRLFKDASGQDQMQIIFTSEGRSKFKEFIINSLDKPFSININGSPYPFAVPVVSQSLIDKPDSDPIITGRLPLDTINEFLIQMKNPFPSKVTATVEGDIDAKLGSTFMGRYFLSFLCGVLISFVFLILKYRKFGLIGSASLILTFVTLLASFKVFSLVISVSSIVALTLLVLILLDITNIVLSRITSNLKESPDKPVDLAIYKGFKDSMDVFRLISITLFISMFILSYFVSRDLKFFISTLQVGVLIIIFHYFYSLRTFMGLFGEKK